MGHLHRLAVAFDKSSEEMGACKGQGTCLACFLTLLLIDTYFIKRSSSNLALIHCDVTRSEVIARFIGHLKHGTIQELVERCIVVCQSVVGPQPGLQLCKGFFDRVKIGRIGRKEC